ncbi:nuclear transport factor 2 family protein [Corynebacterium lubricantis]|uniref:nuclear transport factor 2 family protein n=1 Tax=Corynebacterium lubricantis TaxID=541095 RepID=UPI00039FE86D|nr:nuclear transport factor 2 family protein [Corynebacterium lubricantis]
MTAFTIDELVELEHAGWQSLCESRGGSFYGELLMPDAVFILVNGMVMTRDEIAESLDGAPGWDSYEISQPRIVDAGPEATALVYKATSTRGDLAEPFTTVMTSLYRRIEGQPRLAVYQQTTITH